MKTISPVERNRQVVATIRDTRLYRDFAEAFQNVTGLPLSIQSMHGEAMTETCPQSAFCRMLNARKSCEECLGLHRRLMRETEEHVVTKQCPMGLWETAVPVRLDGETIALLKTGQVRREKPGSADIRALVTLWKRLGAGDEDVEKLAVAYAEVGVMDAGVYEQAVTMLAIFSLQLTTLIEQLALAQGESESLVVTRARQFIGEHLDEKLTLEAVSSAVNVSVFYFCKIFKKAIKMTFTEYVNRERIAWAQAELLKPRLTITEVAFDVGYQSLSQFNRSFLRYVGESPTRFRRRARDEAGSPTAQAA